MAALLDKSLVDVSTTGALPRITDSEATSTVDPQSCTPGGRGGPHHRAGTAAGDTTATAICCVCVVAEISYSELCVCEIS